MFKENSHILCITTNHKKLIELNDIVVRGEKTKGRWNIISMCAKHLGSHHRPTISLPPISILSTLLTLKSLYKILIHLIINGFLIAFLLPYHLISHAFSSNFDISTFFDLKMFSVTSSTISLCIPILYYYRIRLDSKKGQKRL